MSFSIYLETVEAPPCPSCGRHDKAETVWSISGVTHNLNRIVDACLVTAGSPVARGENEGYRERSWGRLDGWKASDALPIAQRAFAEVCSPERSVEFKAMEPENGWGTLRGLQRVFRDFVEALERYPYAIVRTWG